MRFIRWIYEHWRLGYRFRLVVLTPLALFLLAFLYPFQTTTVPQWDLRVVDDAGGPVREIKVTEHWQHYLLEANGHEELQTTNDEGRVSFSPRKVRASLTRRLFGRLRGNANPRGRVPEYGAVVVWGNKDYETTVALVTGATPPAEIQVRRLR